METAAQVLGRLHEKTGVPAEELAIDLTGVNLQAMNLSGGDFQSADFSFADLSGAVLQNSNCEKASFTRTNMVGVHALHIKLKRAHIEQANMTEASLCGADLSQTSLHTGRIYGVDFSFANFDGTYFLEGSKFANVELRKSAMKDIDLSEIHVSAEDLENTFGDASVFLDDNIAPKHWPKVELDDKEFLEQWRQFQTRLPPYG
nr:pentapeptide repeat-containing protein [Pacificibacter marinus]